MSYSARRHRRQRTRLLCPWDSPGKNTGVGCHFLLQCMKVKSQSEFTQSCPSPIDATDCSLPGSSVHGIFQAKVLEWGAICLLHDNPINSMKRQNDRILKEELPRSVSSVHFSRSVISDSLRPMNRSMPGFPVHHQFPEFT